MGASITASPSLVRSEIRSRSTSANNPNRAIITCPLWPGLADIPKSVPPVPSLVATWRSRLASPAWLRLSGNHSLPRRDPGSTLPTAGPAPGSDLGPLWNSLRLLRRVGTRDGCVATAARESPLRCRCGTIPFRREWGRLPNPSFTTPGVGFWPTELGHSVHEPSVGPANSAERRGGITITTFSVPAALARP